MNPEIYPKILKDLIHDLIGKITVLDLINNPSDPGFMENLAQLKEILLFHRSILYSEISMNQLIEIAKQTGAIFVYDKNLDKKQKTVVSILLYHQCDILIQNNKIKIINFDLVGSDFFNNGLGAFVKNIIGNINIDDNGNVYLN